MRKHNLSLILRVLVSLFLLYHLAAVLILPNPSSMLGRKYSRYLADYANNLGINTTWQFFSPGPAPTFYLEYEIETGSEELDEEPQTHQFPERRRASFYDELFNRTMSAMRFFVLAPEETFERFFVPWLCNKHPGAKRISIRTVGEPVVNIERASGEETYEELSHRTALKERQNFSCVSEEVNEAL
jgi:hypothetical protein